MIFQRYTNREWLKSPDVCALSQRTAKYMTQSPTELDGKGGSPHVCVGNLKPCSVQRTPPEINAQRSEQHSPPSTQAECMVHYPPQNKPLCSISNTHRLFAFGGRGRPYPDQLGHQVNLHKSNIWTPYDFK